ncbi:MAG: ADP-ribosylglycohydrolase family protein [Chloroflexota bacterium]
MGYGRGETPDIAERILGGVLGFAAGDAAGAPWEGIPPWHIDPRRIGSPPGQTTDDTAFMWVVAEHIAAENEPSPARFLELLGSPSESDVTSACETVESHGFIERAQGSDTRDPAFQIAENGRAFFREQDSLLRSSS